MLMMSDARTSELIDTLWNVNDGSAGPGLYVHR